MVGVCAPGLKVGVVCLRGQRGALGLEWSGGWQSLKGIITVELPLCLPSFEVLSRDSFGTSESPKPGFVLFHIFFPEQLDFDLVISEF